MKVASATATFLAPVLMVIGLLALGAATTGRAAFAAPSSAIFPVDGVRGPPPPLKSGCSNLVLDKAHSTIPTFAGGPASLAYGCGDGGGAPAFVTTQSHSVKKLTVTPLFSAPAGWILGLSRATGSWGCSSGITPLKSGTPVTLSPRTDYSYCLTTTGASSFSPFPVTWTH